MPDYDSYGLTVGQRREGYCWAHMGTTMFEVTHEWLRDGLLCSVCGSIPRARAISLVIDTVAPDWRRARVWEIAPSGPAADRLRTQCPNYVGSHFWPDLAPGEERHGYLCQDVEAATFDDESFDLIVSQDVFEHVLDVSQGMREIARVLTAGGLHVFTLPQHRHQGLSRPRAERTESGVVHLQPPEYHGNPIDDLGSLVSFDWGLDLENVIRDASGLATTTIRVESFEYGILGEFLEVFVSRKALGSASDPGRHR